MAKYKNKYRIESARLACWDYGKSGYYFVTICTKNRTNILGRVHNDDVELSKIGAIIDRCWHDIPRHFPFVELDEYILMPNHIHGIIVIDKPDENSDVSDRSDKFVETQNLASLQPKNRFGPQSQNLASIIRGFKAGVTKLSRPIYPSFAWQPRFHDHIVRNNADLERIRKYIRLNPSNWKNDEYFTDEKIKIVEKSAK